MNDENFAKIYLIETTSVAVLFEVRVMGKKADEK